MTAPNTCTHAEVPVGPQMKPVVIVLAGSTLEEISRTEGDFGDWIAAGLGTATPSFCVDARIAHEMPTPTSLSGVVVSGSHAMVTDRAPWSERLGEWMKACVAAHVPLLGICYGHQLLAHALGGRAGDHPDGTELGTKTVHKLLAAKADPLFMALPQAFKAHMVHTQSALSLPPDAIPLARNDHDPHQAFRVGACAWGVQFHPEFSVKAMQGYIDHSLNRGTRSTEEIDASAVEAPEVASLLSKFADLAKRRTVTG